MLKKNEEKKIHVFEEVLGLAYHDAVYSDHKVMKNVYTRIHSIDNIFCEVNGYDFNVWAYLRSKWSQRQILLIKTRCWLCWWHNLYCWGSKHLCKVLELFLGIIFDICAREAPNNDKTDFFYPQNCLCFGAVSDYRIVCTKRLEKHSKSELVEAEKRKKMESPCGHMCIEGEREREKESAGRERERERPYNKVCVRE